MSEIGRRLALLLAEPTPVPDTSLTAALAARESALQLLDTLLADGAIGRRANGGGVTELAPEFVKVDEAGGCLGG